MRLKRLTLQGFKTFAPKTDLVFGEGLTAIVGPNGSGKSNVADAVRWALGEQSLSNLRAKRTEDLIFSGSSNRAPVGMAEVSLTIDNADRLLPIDFGEVTLTRRAYRSGENEYFLNKSRVRLRDILDVAATLGQAYTVVGQGLVDAALSLRPEERRELFEEAAAIRGYFVQREDALRRLQKTEENSARVHDLVTELEPQVRRLERQARQADEYSRLEADLRSLLRTWYAGRWIVAVSALEAATIREAECLAEVASRKEVVAAHTRQLAEVRAQVWSTMESLSELNTRRAQAQSRHAAAVQAHAIAAERLSASEHARQGLTRDLLALEASSAAAAGRLRELREEEQRQSASLQTLRAVEGEVEATLRGLDERLSKAEEESRKAGDALNGLLRRRAELETRVSSMRHSLAEKERGLADADRALASLQERVSEAADTLEARHSALNLAQQRVHEAERAHTAAVAQLRSARQKVSTHEESRREAARRADRLAAQHAALEGEQVSGLFPGVRAVLEAARAGKLEGIIGTVGELFSVPAELEGAIEAALGARLQDVCTETWRDAEHAIEMLKRSGAGRATFLPLDTLRATAPLQAPRGKGIVGAARELISYEPRLASVAESVFGRVLIVEDLTVARATVGRLQVSSHWTLATLAGEVVRPGGSVTGGSTTKSGDAAARERSLLARARRRRELAAALEEARQELRACDTLLAEALAGAQAAERESNRCSAALDEARRAHAAAQIAHAEQQSLAARAQQELAWRLGLMAATKEEIVSLQNACQADQYRIEDLTAELETARDLAVRQQQGLEQLRKERDSLYEATRDSRTRAAVILESIRNLKERAFDLERETAQVETRYRDLTVQLSRAGEEENALRAQLTHLQEEAERLASTAAEIEESISPREQQARHLESEAVALEEKLALLQTALLEQETAHSRAAVDTQRCIGILGALRVEVVEELSAGGQPAVARDLSSSIDAGGGETLSETVSPEPPVELGQLPDGPPSPDQLAELERRVVSYRARLNRIGPVNPLAQAEHKALADRHSYLQTQLTDLLAAADSLRRVISELDRAMREQFAATFALVNQEFGVFFTALFGGGTARLELTNPDDVASTGIDIFAQPPGKRLQPLAALSGGERALTSAALLFALLKVRPVPFCVLDEVDAALDESNVSRFNAALRQLGERTQFVVITHNRGTIEAADTLYGVSMAGDGTSQLLSLKADVRATA